MNREFPISTRYKIFYAVMALGMFGFGLFLLTERTSAGIAIYLFPLLFMISGIGLLAGKLKSNISIYPDSVVQTNLFKTKSIALSDITGFRILSKVFYIESATSKITVRGYSELTDYEGLLQWLRENYQDLDSADYKADLQKILADTNLGYTEQDREVALKKAKIVAFSYNIIGVLLTGLMFLIRNNSVFDIILLLYPLISPLILFTGKGLIRFYIEKRSPYYSIYFGVFAVIISIIIKSIADCYVLQVAHLWPIALIISLVFFAALKFTDPEKTATTVGMASIFLFLVTGLLYGFFGTRLLNSEFDNSSEQVFDASVINHSITHSKGTHYHLVIGSWGPQKDMDNIDVSETEYYQDTIGSTVNVHLKKGLLNIPWYTISK